MRFYFTSAKVQLLFDKELIQKYTDLSKQLEKSSNLNPILRCINNLKLPGVSTVEELLQENTPNELVFPTIQGDSKLVTEVADQIQSQGHFTGTEMSYNLGGSKIQKH